MVTELEILERFQTAIVGVIGFSGVILTLIVNSCVATKERAEMRRHQRTALRSMLIAELDIWHTALEDAIERCQAARPGQGVIVPNDPMDKHYRAAVHQIGALGPQEVIDIALAYAHIRQYLENILLLEGAEIFDKYRLKVPPQSVAALAALQTSVVAKVNHALEAIASAAKSE